jgi:hypothetical protein
MRNVAQLKINPANPANLANLAREGLLAFFAADQA